MIVPMKKVCMVMQDKVQDEALTKLREIGVLHLEKSGATSDKLSKVIERKARAESAIGLILPYKAPKKKSAPQGHGQQDGRDNRMPLAPGQTRGRRAVDKLGSEELSPYSLDAVNAPNRSELIDLMVDMGKHRKTLQDRQIFLNREKARIAAWGEFEPDSVRELAGLGQPLFLYELSIEAFVAIPPDTRYIKTGEDKTSVRLVVLDKELPGVTVFQLPEKSLSAIIHEEEVVKFHLDELEKRIKSFADRRPILAKDMAAIQRDIDFETVRATMETVEDVPEDLRFSYLTGFVPAEDMGHLKRAAAENGWALISEDPGPDDKVPTKLKNSRFVNLLTPLTGFLEIVPGYNEIDISGIFLFFFTIFFGMIFGDAAYGIMLFLIAIIAMIKTAKTGVPQFFKFLLLMSISNIVWGVMTCTWFGVELQYVPQALKDISFPLFSEAKTDPDKVSQNLQIFCFSLALIHLSIAHLIGIGRNIKSLKVFAEIGSLTMLWGMYVVVLWLVVSNPAIVNGVFPFVPVLQQYADLIFRLALYLLGGGFILTFIFANYEGSVGQSVLTSVKNIITVVLGITNVFSDIMSYIRLWAVGLAGASIAATINTMAGPMLGNFLVFAGIILLAAGHGLNLVLNVLSVLVHGVRLNILEFSGHVGLAWAGTAYKPFAETAKK